MARRATSYGQMYAVLHVSRNLEWVRTEELNSLTNESTSLFSRLRFKK